MAGPFVVLINCLKQAVKTCAYLQVDFCLLYGSSTVICGNHKLRRIPGYILYVKLAEAFFVPRYCPVGLTSFCR